MAHGTFRQVPADVAVVIPTILRPSLTRAVRSIFAQDLNGRIQILVGIDVARGDPGQLDTLRRECPENVQLDVLDFGYSTYRGNGGLYPCIFGGVLRTIMSFQAHSRYVAYLDDDNWFAPDHLSSLLATVRGVAWAYSLRWMVDPRNLTPICIDDWESVGPDKGMFAKSFGGFVDTNTLLIDKLACPQILHLWSQVMFADRVDGEDRLIFNALKEGFRGRASDAATAYYVARETDMLRGIRHDSFRRHGYQWEEQPSTGEPPLPDLPDPALARSRQIAGLLSAVQHKAETGGLQAALGLIEQLMAYAPGNRDVLRQMGRLCVAMGHVGDARTIFDSLRAQDPGDGETLAEIAALGVI